MPNRKPPRDNSNQGNVNDDNLDYEKKYRLLFEKLSIGIFQFNVDTEVIDCNDRFAEIFHSDKAKLIGLRVNQLNDKNALSALDEAISGKQGYYEGVVHSLQGNAETYINLKTLPIFSEDNRNVIGGFGIVEDVTARKTAEQELGRKEQYFRIISSITTDASSVLTFNADGTFNGEIISDSFSSLVGYSPDDLNSIGKWREIIHPEDLPAFNSALDRIKLEEKVSLDFRIMARNGKIFWINNTVYPEYDEKGTSVRFISALKDITERKEAEVELNNQKNLLDTIVNVAPIGIWMSAPDGTYSFINRYFRDVIGYDTPEISLTPEEIKSCKLSDGEALRSDSLVEAEEKLTFVDGKVHTVNVLKRRVVFNNKELILGIGTDISEHKRYEKALVDALDKAEESDRLKSAFLANVSHEIRTPLNGIVGFAEYLRNYPETGKSATLKFLNIICNSADHLLSLINDIIDISKIEANQLKINPESLNLNSLLNEIYSFYHTANPDLAEQGISLRVITSLSDLDSNVTVDKVRLRQILSNLIGNALKFTNRGSIEFGYEVTPGKPDR
ncbi:MAG: PAS domain S-box protein, partial [Bacteroidales bacterium]